MKEKLIAGTTNAHTPAAAEGSAPNGDHGPVGSGILGDLEHTGVLRLLAAHSSSDNLA